VNLILKRLVRRGYVKSRGLNAKKVEYFLTPKGFAEKVKKSYSYIFKTINLVKVIQDQIREIVSKEYGSGAREFAVLGEGSLSDQVMLVLSEMDMQGLTFRRIRRAGEQEKKELILATEEDIKKVNGNRVINIAEKLSDIYWGVE